LKKICPTAPISAQVNTVPIITSFDM
jgi:hypothetical protein